MVDNAREVTSRGGSGQAAWRPDNAREVTLPGSDLVAAAGLD